MRHAIVYGMIVGVGLAVACAAAGCREESDWTPTKPEPQDAQPPLPTATVTVGDVSLEVEVADEEAERARGYMFRDPPADGGMLFVFPDESRRRFIMRNVPFDIDLAFMSAGGTVTQVVRMKAFSSREYPSRMPAKYALEVAAGWFRAHGVTEGTRAAIPADIQAKD